MSRPDLDLLRGVWLFQSLDEAAVAELSALARTQTHGEESLVYRHGESPHGLYFIRQGAVVLVKDAVGKPVQLLKRLETGDFFGEAGLLEGLPHEESARTVEATQILLLPREPLLAFLEHRPLVRLQLRRAAIDRASANIAAALSLSTRQEVRIKVGRRVVLTLADGSTVDSVLENLSLGGAALSAAPESWLEGRPVAFYLGPPERPELLHLVGKVAWRKGKRAGIAFDGATTELKVRVSSALQELLPRRTTPQVAR